MTDRIILSGMIFFGYHGVLPAERSLGQRFVVDLELHCDLQAAGLNDDLTRTVDYRQVHEATRALIEGEPVNLIETLAERIAATVLAQQPIVEAVRVRVSKPNVRLGATVMDGAAVDILRERVTR